MPVLILAIASVLLLIAVLGLVALADALDSRSLRKQVMCASAIPPVCFSIVDAYDPVYSLLWEAPVEALTVVDAAGMTGVRAVTLRRIYKRAAAQFPEIYDGWDFAAWLQFLEKTQLVSWNALNLVVTPDGKAFIRFRFVTDSTAAA
ncbi:MAG TPA: hypothetical protein VH437_09765 [Terriglobales bacterium]|jgi:hypothetical protein